MNVSAVTPDSVSELSVVSALPSYHSVSNKSFILFVFPTEIMTFC